MPTELIFKILNTAVLPAWLLMMIFPSKKITQQLVYSHLFIAAIALIYALLIFWGMAENRGGDGGMESLQSLRTAFENDKVLLAAWAHYLAFDMFVGSWIAQDARSKNLSKIITAVCLLFTLMLGPVGFLLYKLYLRLVNNQLKPTA